MGALPLDKADSGAPCRGFAELHRDLWRLFMASPYVTFSLSMGLLFLVYHSRHMAILEGGGRLTTILYRFATQYVSAMIMATVISVALSGHGGKQGRPTLRGMDMAGDVALTVFAVVWRVTIGTLLLVIPGIYLMLRYSLAVPVTVIEGRRGSDAIERSGELMEGRYGAALLRYVLLLLLIAPPFVACVGFSLLLPEPIYRSLLAAMASFCFVVPFSLLATLLYADYRPDFCPPPPLGVAEAGKADLDPRFLLAAAAIAIYALFIWVLLPALA